MCWFTVICHQQSKSEMILNMCAEGTEGFATPLGKEDKVYNDITKSSHMGHKTGSLCTYDYTEHTKIPILLLKKK